MSSVILYFNFLFLWNKINRKWRPIAQMYWSTNDVVSRRRNDITLAKSPGTPVVSCPKKAMRLNCAKSAGVLAAVAKRYTRGLNQFTQWGFSTLLGAVTLRVSNWINLDQPRRVPCWRLNEFLGTLFSIWLPLKNFFFFTVYCQW